ncbi:zinc-binding alcohol dehydrogenase [Opitutia bacterium ISCC 51]|nr:zinc-binding alcohol dehydrogenase [Opitutae bacterium ISCC 51]QXD26910.1 zinc-binding alcohol dehydrogenase [Opitutae bacterium ISCC 52]
MSTKIPTSRTVLTLHGDGSFRRMESDMPELGPGMVLIKAKASLVSPGTELKGPVSRGSKAAGGWRGLRELQLNPDESLKPKPFGYANAGIVGAVGAEVHGLKEGDRVASIGAGYAQHSDYSVVPQNLVVSLPEEASYEQGAYGMLLATGMQALRRGDPKMGEYVAVAGMGIVGFLTARLFQIAGCYAIGWDTIDSRLQLAKDLGIDETAQVLVEDEIERTKAFTRGRGLDISVVALGGDATRPAHALEKCMKVTGDGHAMGTMVIVGGAEFPFTRSLTNMDVRRSSRTGAGYHDKAWERGRNHDDVFVRWDTKSNLELCLRLVAEGKIAVEKLTTHRVPFGQLEEETKQITQDPDSILGMIFEYE